MESIRDSLMASVEEEDDLERASSSDSDAILNNIFNALETLTREKSADEASLEENIRGSDI